MERRVWVEKIVPLFIFLALWLDGWFLPLILLPVLHVLFVEKKSLGWLGFSKRPLRFSIAAGTLVASVVVGLYYPIFLYYLTAIVERGTVGLYDFFWDVVWYPLYEEFSYRAFLLAHFADFNRIASLRNIIINLFQSLLFISIHKHHFGLPLILIPVFMLGLLNGFLFLKTRNIYGCIVSHSIVNALALLLRYLQAG